MKITSFQDWWDLQGCRNPKASTPEEWARLGWQASTSTALVNGLSAALEPFMNQPTPTPTPTPAPVIVGPGSPDLKGPAPVGQPIGPVRTADIENRFTYHPPKEGQPEKYLAIREKAKELALLIAELTPASREQSTALTHLETSVFFANAAIARS